MRTTRRRAFTLPELLIVIAIIGVLAALLIVSMSSAFRLSERAECAANLHYLHQAMAMRRSDSLQSERPPMKLALWATRWGVLPYVDFDQDVLICPAQGATEDLAYDPGEIAEWGEMDAAAQEVLEYEPYQNVEISDLIGMQSSHGYYVEFKDSYRCVKLSDSQWQRARDQGLLSNAGSANHFRDKWDEEFKPDSSGDVWYCFEDAGDWDFKDLMVKVHDNGDGTFSLSCYSGYTIFINTIVSLPGKEPLQPVRSGTDNLQLTVGEAQEEDEGTTGGYESVTSAYQASTTADKSETFMTNYGLNAQSAITQENSRYLSDEPGRILLLDYYKPLAVASDGLDWPSPGVTPPFARHQGYVNVLFTDGAVKAMEPWKIHPGLEKNRFQYWGS